ncbi:MAG: hypothetical protein QOI12_4338 [Alphaproteobacteria bacterium]|jgi:tripartite-type tricarboxylate transporter receptor subunit TctC|nr:hypothetical protein [Alphaproteobacteria bacterium]
MGRLLLGAAAILALASAAHADDFYRGKQIKLLVGADPGGSYDIHARLIARFLAQHIPGNPQILVQNMQGAGSLNAANFVYGVAPQDGTVMVAVLQTIVQNQLSNDRNVKFDAGRFQWIGNPTASVNVIVTWHSSPVKTLQDAMAEPAVIGITSQASSGGMEVALANNVLGTKFQAVTGYRGGNEIDIALERGEVVGRAGQSWAGWKQTRPGWIRDQQLNILAQIGQARARDLAHVPLITEAADGDEKRQILALYSDGIALGRPLLVGPGVPAERVAILRLAFRQTIGDPRFLEEAARLGVDIEPIHGAELQAIVGRMLATPRDIVGKLDDAIKLKSGTR